MLFITKIFSFEAAHALKDYNGACANIHGHSYRLEVSVAALEDALPEDGMLLDFHDIKSIVETALLNKFDHALLLNSSVDSALAETLRKQFEKVLLLPFQPTSENLILHFAKLLKDVLPDRLRLKRLILYETATSYVTYEE